MSDVWVRDELTIVFDPEASIISHDRCYVRSSVNGAIQGIGRAIEYERIGDHYLTSEEVFWLRSIKRQLTDTMGQRV